jgi:hypothetical protein
MTIDKLQGKEVEELSSKQYSQKVISCVIVFKTAYLAASTETRKSTFVVR